MQFERSLLPILVLNKNLVITKISKKAKEMFLLSEKLIGRSFLPIIDLDHSSSIKIPKEFKIDRKHSTCACEINALILSLNTMSEDESYLVHVSYDDEDNSTDIQSAKLQALGTLAGGIAHDLNNMLMAVLGHLSYLKITNLDFDYDSLKAAEEGARMAAKLSQQILDFARKQQASPENIDLCKIITSAIPLLSPSLPEGIKVSFKAKTSPLFVSMEESQISQIILNLLINARDAIVDKGEIILEVDKHSVSSSKIINGFNLVQGDYAHIIVKDNGLGMSNEIKDRIFEPFFTTKRGTGTGLGLATVFFIIKSLRGAIDVNSVEDKGTSFSVLLPLAEVYDLSESSPANSLISSSSAISIIDKDKNSNQILSDSTSNQSIKILVVDDEDAVRMVLQKSLELLGYQVLSAENGISALEIFSKECSSISLVVMDMIMPQMPGYQLFYELKKINNNVKVLISSGYSSDAKTSELLSNGALGLIQKPFAIEELAHEVERCLGIS